MRLLTARVYFMLFILILGGMSGYIIGQDTQERSYQKEKAMQTYFNKRAEILQEDTAKLYGLYREAYLLCVIDEEQSTEKAEEARRLERKYNKNL